MRRRFPCVDKLDHFPHPADHLSRLQNERANGMTGPPNIPTFPLPIRQFCFPLELQRSKTGRHGVLRCESLPRTEKTLKGHLLIADQTGGTSTIARERDLPRLRFCSSLPNLTNNPQARNIWLPRPNSYCEHR